MTGLSGYASLVAHDGIDRAEPAWRREARLTALDWLGTHPMPTARDEPWHYTPVDKVLAGLDRAERPGPPARLDPAQVAILAGDHGGTCLVFVNGVFDAGASHREPVAGASVGPISHLDPTARPWPVAAGSRTDGFVALNGAAADDGASVSIGAGTSTPLPIHIVHVAMPELDRTIATHPEAHIHLAEGTRASIIESYIGIGGAVLTNASTVIDVGDGAVLTYHRVQSEVAQAIHVGHVRVRVGSDAEVRATSVSIGAAISRVAVDVTIEGDRSRVDVDGLYVPSGEQHHDHVITLEHAGSHTSSTQRFRGVMDDRARGSFTGQIIVNPDTVDTSAHQTNHSVLLTPTAQSDSRPWLEILADDVRCTHGATVGRLDDQALFYLRSRGIPAPLARRILIEAFTSEITDAVEPASLRDHLNARLTARRAHLEEAG